MMWLNGELLENGEVAAAGAGNLLGWGVFTTLGVRDGRPRFLARHFARLERDARLADVPFELEFAMVEHGLSKVLRANRVRNGLARLTLTRRGDGRWNAEAGADLSILAQETAPFFPEFRVQLSRFRVEAKRPLCGVKTTAYLPYWWAWREAKANGFDEAILREGRDFLCEGARASLFWARDGTLFTPSFETGCLAGIGRELALEWAAQSALEVREGAFGTAEAESANEIWLVSAASGSRAVTVWHDEAGEMRAHFPVRGALCAEFGRWFEKQTETGI
jgi:branched-chain amino acid aminotransferase